MASFLCFLKTHGLYSSLGINIMLRSGYINGWTMLYFFHWNARVLDTLTSIISIRRMDSPVWCYQSFLNLCKSDLFWPEAFILLHTHHSRTNPVCFCVPVFRQFLFVVAFTTFLFNCVEYDVLFANRVVNHTGQSLGPLDRNKVTLPDAILPGEQCTERSVMQRWAPLVQIEFSFACSNLLVTLNLWFI